MSSLPDVPTVAESGYPGFETSQWYGLLAPAGTPKSVITKLNSEIATALKSPETMRKIAEDGALVIGGTPEEFATLIAREIERWGQVVKTAGIKAE